ncbi:class I SAM-dependent methyltransferase [Corynebacterium cystitidis]|uniref:class I SAM-dependent methyltransferase n=1 Tax=Corynebacterium cystitidis TaxID=35757 RepID=UPI00211E6F08|nr:class I SAM-dependent methyltransferase [Corynebacterium cystitidis]
MSTGQPTGQSRWDLIADSFYKRLKHRHNDDLLAALEEFDATPHGGTVLDVCCGPGWHLNTMADKIAHGVGVDSSARMIELARNDAPDNLTFIQHDWTTGVPEGLDDGFDLVIANRCPAIRDGAAVEKLHSLARQTVIMASPVYKHVDVMEELVAAIPDAPEYNPNRMGESFGMKLGEAFRIGAQPQLRHSGFSDERELDRASLKAELSMHVDEYGPGLFDAIDRKVGPEETITIRVTMRFVLAIWKVT